MNKDRLFADEKYTCGLRAAGVLVRDNMILVQRDKDGFVSQKDNCDVVLEWMPVEELRNVTVYPEFLKDEIYHLNEPIKHFVSKG